MMKTTEKKQQNVCKKKICVPHVSFSIFLHKMRDGDGDGIN